MTNRLCFLLLMLASSFQSAFATDWLCKVAGGQEEPYKLEITRVPLGEEICCHRNENEIIFKLTKEHALQFNKFFLKEVVPLLFSFLEIANKKFVKNGYLKAYEYVLKYCQNGTIIISHVCTNEKKENAKCHVLPKSKEELFPPNGENGRLFPLVYLGVMSWILAAGVSGFVLICYVIKALWEKNLSENILPISFCLNIIFSIPAFFYFIMKKVEEYENQANNKEELSIAKEKILTFKKLIEENLQTENKKPIFIKSSFYESRKDLEAMIKALDQDRQTR